MQLFAANENNQPIFANNALKQKDYHCLECHGVVRLRSGIHRQKHFYHTHSAPHCHQQGKGIVHLMTQMHLLKILPEGEAKLEVRFPQMGRIADVAWDSQKIVFEVQCASISAEEVLERNRDYQKMGWQPVWILHDQRYNQKRISAAEFVLRSHPHYFTNMNSEGHGIIYDQFDLHQKGFKTQKMGPLSINLGKRIFFSTSNKNLKNPLKIVQQRINSWSCYFENDLFDISQIENSEYIIEAKRREAEFYKPIKMSSRIRKIFSLLARPYVLGFQMLLEKLCR